MLNKTNPPSSNLTSQDYIESGQGQPPVEDHPRFLNDPLSDLPSFTQGKPKPDRSTGKGGKRKALNSPFVLDTRSKVLSDTGAAGFHKLTKESEERSGGVATGSMAMDSMEKNAIVGSFEASEQIEQSRNNRPYDKNKVDVNNQVEMSPGARDLDDETLFHDSKKLHEVGGGEGQNRLSNQKGPASYDSQGKSESGNQAAGQEYSEIDIPGSYSEQDEAHGDKGDDDDDTTSGQHGKNSSLGEPPDSTAKKPGSMKGKEEEFGLPLDDGGSGDSGTSSESGYNKMENKNETKKSHTSNKPESSQQTTVQATESIGERNFTMRRGKKATSGSESLNGTATTNTFKASTTALKMPRTTPDKNKIDMRPSITIPKDNDDEFSSTVENEIDIPGNHSVGESKKKSTQVYSDLSDQSGIPEINKKKHQPYGVDKSFSGQQVSRKTTTKTSAGAATVTKERGRGFAETEHKTVDGGGGTTLIKERSSETSASAGPAKTTLMITSLTHAPLTINFITTVGMTTAAATTRKTSSATATASDQSTPKKNAVLNRNGSIMNPGDSSGKGQGVEERRNKGEIKS